VVIGLPDNVTACLFDLDGVLTPTATVHSRAWQETFDAFLAERAGAAGQQFAPFDPDADYSTYVDGRPRADGVRNFLASRGITLPEGGPDDPPQARTVHGLGNRKNQRLLELIRSAGIQPYPGSRRYLEAARDAGLRRAVVSASANCREVLVAAGIEDLLEVRVDGAVARQRQLAGKPQPDTFLEAARLLGVAPGDAAVFEDALAGVAAGRAGRFGYVVGVDRTRPTAAGAGEGEEEEEGARARALREHGADIVVGDLSELLP
jgi:beta-phosphoglucomutase family hydrolase